MSLVRFRTILVALSCLVLLGAQAAPPLNALIRQNIAAARTTYKVLANPNPLGPQLWIHVRSKAQMSLVQSGGAWLRTLRWKGMPIEIRPTELVGYGPSASELRFFRPEDRAATAQLQAQLSAGITRLQLKDMSAEYSKATWLKPGHLELWLASDAARFGPAH